MSAVLFGAGIVCFVVAVGAGAWPLWVSGVAFITAAELYRLDVA